MGNTLNSFFANSSGFLQQFGKLPVRLGAEFHYDVITPDDKAGAQWSFRVFAVPVIPAPWGELGKALKKKK